MTKPKSKSKKSDAEKDAGASQESKGSDESSPTAVPVGGSTPGATNATSPASSRASPGVSPAPHRSSPIAWFTSHIQSMMYGFGDCNKPLIESARLIEEITHQQMNSLLSQLTDIATARGTKIIGLEDILFLLRKDRVKLSRLIRYVTIKDKVSSFQKPGFEEQEDVQEEIKQMNKSKRRKTVQDFFSVIDQTGELMSLLDEDALDEVKVEREMRADWQSRSMETAEYLKFAAARQVTFCHKTRITRFRDWLLRDNPTEGKVHVNAMAMEVLNYMAYETVAQIVDLSLLVKKDMNSEGADLVTKSMTPACVCAHHPSIVSGRYLTGQPSTPPQSPTRCSPPPSPSQTPAGQVIAAQQPQTSAATKAKSKKRKKSTGPEYEAPYSMTILPADIREAVRRYLIPRGPLVPFSKIHKSHLSTRLLCM